MSASSPDSEPALGVPGARRVPSRLRTEYLECTLPLASASWPAWVLAGHSVERGTIDSERGLILRNELCHIFSVGPHEPAPTRGQMLFGIQQGPYNRRPSIRSLASLLPLDKGGAPGTGGHVRSYMGPDSRGGCQRHSLTVQLALISFCGQVTPASVMLLCRRGVLKAD